MPFPDELFEETYGTIRGKILREPNLAWRDKLLSRYLVRWTLDEGWDWLEREQPILEGNGELFDRGSVAASLRSYLRAQYKAQGQERFGVPIWAFFVILKLVMLLIEIWLLHGSNKGKAG